MPNELDKSLEELGLALAVRPEAYEAVRKSAQTHEGVYMSSGVALRLIKIMDAATAATKAFTASPAILSLEKDAAAGSKQWVIISKKEGRGLPYWRANSAGYADSITQAGLYTYTEARKITAGNHGDDEKYCIDDPALAELISSQSYLRGKELTLWLENAALLARVQQVEANQAATRGLPSLYERGEAAAGQWISVKERLPEHGQLVLIYRTATFGGEAGVEDAKYQPDFVRDMPWLATRSGWVASFRVTHWQPLPTAPTTTSKEDSQKGEEVGRG